MNNGHIFSKGNLISILLLVLFFVALIKPLLNTPAPVASKKIALVDNVSAEFDVELPLHDVEIPDFSAIQDVRNKKRAFFTFLVPAIEQENVRIEKIRMQVVAINSKLTSKQPLYKKESALIKSLTNKYKVSKKLSPLEKTKELIKRVDIVPAELVLVQAANESAWGTSRFARIGLNFFGMWCYKKGCGMVPNGRDTGLKHEVAAFESVEHAVQRYLHNINTNPAYRVLRDIRSQLHQQSIPLSAEILATGLLSYSERGTDYILELTEMLRHNQRYFDEIYSD